MRLLKKKFYFTEITFCILTILVGTLLYFSYEWSNYNIYLAYIAPVNNSIWEHLKMLLFPVLLFSIIEYIMIGKCFSAFIPTRTIAFFSGVLFMIIFFYTYSGILGANHLLLDLIDLYLSVIIIYYLTWRQAVDKRGGNVYANIFCSCIMFFLVYIFITFTNNPPQMNLFREIKPKLIQSMRTL